MKTKFIFLSLLGVLLVWAVSVASLAAEGPGPNPPAAPLVDRDGWFADSGSHLLAPAAADAPAVVVGQPGLSFRYVRTFGETERPYLDDTNHFYDVSGMGVDGANVWIADSWGNRVLKFDGDGAFQQQIGKAGVLDATGVSLDFVSDVAVDQSGNTWVVDAGARHVAKYDATGKHVGELGKAWEGGSGNDRFNDPISIAFDSAGNIYISDAGVWGDYGNQRVQVFDSAGTYRTTIGVTGVAGSDNGHFRSPRRIAIYANRLYIADAGNQRVQVFDVSNPSSPAYVATLGVSGVSGSDSSHFDYPEGVGVDANFIYVADSNNQRVQIFNRNTRVYVATLGAGAWGTDNNHFNHPSDVVVDSAGRIYVADNYNKRVQQFDSSRVYRRTYGTTGVAYITDGYHYYNPVGVAVTGDGSIYIAEERGHRLVKLNAAGDPLWNVGEPGQNGNDNAHFFGPSGVATDSAGRAYVTEGWSNYRVQIFSPDGAYYATLGTGYGTGNYEFKSPQGVAVGSAGIFVADNGNHRVQVYSSNRQYLGTIGVTSVSGSDNAHFNGPQGVAMDDGGNVYVADQNNHRVQKCSGAGTIWTCTTIAGATGVSGNDFGHLSNPTAVAVDAQRRIYVADQWGGRVQVFDAMGAYLTTVGGSQGTRSSQMRSSDGLAVDAFGNLYVAERSNNQRIQKFAPGVPGWRQVNINGFGDRANGNIHTLASFAGQLYAGTFNSAGKGAQMWRMDATGAWTQPITAGFGITRNIGINHLLPFNGQLYAGVRNDQAGAQVYRSSDGAAWNPVATAGFGDPQNSGVYRLAEFGGQLYAGTSSWAAGHGGEIWRSPSGDNGSWERVVNGGLDDPKNYIMRSSAVHNGYLYFGTQNVDTSNYMTTTGAVVIRSATGAAGSWAKVTASGFGDINNSLVSSLLSFNGYLYAGTARWNTSGVQVWRCQTCDGAADWEKVVDGGFGDPYNWGMSTLHSDNGVLYLVIGNGMTGIEVWRSSTGNGGDWARESKGGFGDSNNNSPYVNNVATHDGRLYIGTQNGANGAEVWVKTLTADFTATPTRGAPPLTVQFANTSSGDFTLSEWNFGDGVTSTMKVPTHTYTLPGVYTVTLTVSNKTDTSTVMKSAYIDVHQRVFLPLVLKNYDPLLYDNFDDPAWDGAWNTAKWRSDAQPSSPQFRQQGGLLVVTNPAVANPTSSSLIETRLRRWQQLQLMEARLKISSDRNGGWSPVGIAVIADGINGTAWYATCTLGGSGQSSRASYGCYIFQRQGDSYPVEYGTSSISVDYNTWHTARIETDPSSAFVRFYLDNTLIGSHAPKDAAVLLTNNMVHAWIISWAGSPNSSATRSVDDVRITLAR